MNVHRCFFTSTLVATLLSGCGSSSNGDGAHSPDDVSSPSVNDGTSSDSTPKDSAKTDRPDHDTKAMPRAPKSTNEPDSVPDDYTLTDRDCIELAKHYAVVQKADQLAEVNPKLTNATTAQKEQADKTITDAVTKLAESWENGCRTSLVGGVVDRRRLKCAMSAKSVKGFDECINGELPK